MQKLKFESEQTRDTDKEFRNRINDYLDAGYGECILRQPEIAQIVLDSWLYENNVSYDLLPNHVHVIVYMKNVSLSKIIKNWKSSTSHKINNHLKRSGQIWQPDYWDRFIQNIEH